MFIGPLFLPSAVDGELQAVDSEHTHDASDDGTRVWQVERSKSNPNHPWSYFEGGNLDTLKTGPEARGINVRDSLLEFFRRYTSANRMKLVVLAREPPHVLKEWVLELFTDIVNLDLPESRWEMEAPLRPEDLGNQCFVKLIMDHNWVDLTFRFLDETSMLGCQPSQYFGHLLHHGASGGILSHLKSKGATQIHTAHYHTGPGSPGVFLWRMHLTKDGLREYREVVKVFFHYIALLRSAPPQEWFFNELVTLADYAFKFKEKTSAGEYTTQTSSVMQTPVPREWLLSGNR
jgi:insulysin